MRHVLRRITAMLILFVVAVSCAEAVSLPSSLTEIEDEAFRGSPFQDLTIPDSVEHIGSLAFADSSLTHVTIPASVTSFGTDPFLGVPDGFFATVVPGSAAETWCIENNVSYSYTGTAYTAPSVKAARVPLYGFQYLGTSYSVMDCQAFVEQCLQDAGLTINLAGSNSWYRAMDWVGTPEECIAQFGFIPPGAFLFIVEYDGNEPSKYRGDGLGNASHIGLYTAIGQGAIHSSKSKGGVYESYFKGKTINGGWNRVGLWKRLDWGITINLWLALHGK